MEIEIVDIRRERPSLGAEMDGLARAVVAALTKWHRLPLEPRVVWVKEPGSTSLGFVVADVTDFWTASGPDFSRWAIFLNVDKCADPRLLPHVVAHEVAHLEQALRDGRILSRGEMERYAEMEARSYCRRTGWDSICIVCQVPIGDYLRSLGPVTWTSFIGRVRA